MQGAITTALSYIETELRELEERIAGNLKQLTEKEFAELVFEPTEDMQ